jgi:hypothetical protein
LSTLSIFIKQTTYLATLPNPKISGKRNGRNSNLNRRTFLQAAATFSAIIAAPPLPWAQEKSKLNITSIRLVSWSTQGVEVSAPLNIYPEFKPSRSLFEAKGVDSFTVEVTPAISGKNVTQGYYAFALPPQAIIHKVKKRK